MSGAAGEAMQGAHSTAPPRGAVETAHDALASSRKLADLRAQLRDAIGTIVPAMMAMPRYRHLALADLQHLVIDPLLRDRISIARPAAANVDAPKEPAGFAIWASVSDEVDARIQEQVRAGGFPIHRDIWKIKIMWRHALLKFLTYSQDEIAFRKLKTTYVRFWIVSGIVFFALLPFRGLVASLAAASPIAFLLIITTEVACGHTFRVPAPGSTFRSRLIMFVGFVLAMSLSATVNAVDALTVPTALNESTAVEFATRYIIVPFVTIVSIRSCREMRVVR